MTNFFRPEHTKLLQDPVLNMKDLQDRWNRPTAFPIDKKRVLLLTTFVSLEIGELAWVSSGRLMNIGSRKIKPTAVWLSFEKLRALDEIKNALEFLGEGEGTGYTSTNAVHHWKRLTPEEMGVVMSIKGEEIRRRTNKDGIISFGSVEPRAPSTDGEKEVPRWKKFIGSVWGRAEEKDSK